MQVDNNGGIAFKRFVFMFTKGYNKGMGKYYYKTSAETKRNSKTFDNLQNLYPDIVLIEGSIEDLINYREKIKTGSTVYFNDYFKLLDDCKEYSRFFLFFYMECYYSNIDVCFINTPECNISYIKSLLTVLDIHPRDDETELVVGKLIENNIKQAKINQSMAFNLKSTALQTAKENGVQIGVKKGTVFKNPKADSLKEKIKMHSKAFNGNMSDVELIEKLGIPRTTYYKYKREIKHNEKTAK